MTPLVPLRDTVMFPGAVASIFVGRSRSMGAIEAAGRSDERFVFAVAQRQRDLDEPGPDDLQAVGTICRLLQVIHMPDGVLKVLLEGVRRMRARSYALIDGRLSADLVIDRVDGGDRLRLEALRRVTTEQFQQYVELMPSLPSDLLEHLSLVDDPDRAADLMAFHNELAFDVRQSLLECFSPSSRLELLLRHLTEEVEILKVKRELHTKTAAQIGEKQKEHFLREQLQLITSELGNDGDAEYGARIDSTELPENVRRVLAREKNRLATMAPMSPESTVVRTYMDWLLDLPWMRLAPENHDLTEARRVLETSHFGLQKVKDRLMEFMAARILAGPGARAQILCLVGPPGVGKTSLGRSVAQALGRPFVTFSLGGMRDEAEIRGHRRTYIGALPGRVIQKMKEAECRNPVMMLDEVDKLGSDFRGDPAAALLEVLDPEQNGHFTDHYVELSFDLSDVLFITTANVTHTIPAPLLDRMELLELPSYMPEEKEQIARRHLIPRLYTRTGVSREQFQITMGALRELIGGFTRESGVRELDRKLTTLFRKRAVTVLEERAQGRTTLVKLKKSDLASQLGTPRTRDDKLPRTSQSGLALGLAWTADGGEVLTVEAAAFKGMPGLTLTGNLGAVMQESAQAALGCLRSHWAELSSASEPDWSELSIHVHLPEGAIPKDGPSAGVTLATAILSALTGRAFHHGRAMTGEISLSGRVLAVGGLREKILAAKRMRLSAVAVPKANEGDVADLESWVTEGIDVTYLTTIVQATTWALEGERHGLASDA